MMKTMNLDRTGRRISLMTRKYYSMLFGGTLTMMVTVILLMSDSVIAGAVMEFQPVALFVKQKGSGTPYVEGAVGSLVLFSVRVKDQKSPSVLLLAFDHPFSVRHADYGEPGK